MTRTTRALPAALALAALSLLTGAGPAGAATYQSVQCSALGAAAPDAHEYAIGAFATFADFCNGEGGYLGLGVQGTASSDPPGSAAGWLFSAPPATSFVGASVVAKGKVGGGVIPELLASQPGQFTWGTPSSDTEQPFTWEGETGPHDGILVQLRCTTVPYPCPSSSDAYALARQFVFTLAESAAPKIDELGSALVESAPTDSLRGEVVVGVSASDAGSGLDVAYVETADKRLATAHYACTAIPASPGRPRLGRRLAPCPGQGGKFLTVDTADPAFHTGLNHGVRVCVADFSRQTSCQDGPDVRIDNACPDAGVGVAALANVRLKGGVGSSGKANVKKTRFGRKVKIRGRALNGAGGPVEGATICLGHHLAGDTYGGEEVNWTKTGPKGRFRFKLQRGPNQDFRVAAWQG
ncbi:MAG: hypothetical protein GEU28_14335, partial [Dehalococcoidia bacterium]|nr:hypothetical protein [Dehalococcoidia bacterium]